MFVLLFRSKVIYICDSQSLGCWDPARTCVYLPFATRKHYWEEAIAQAKVEFPDRNWDTTFRSFELAWIGEASPWRRCLKISKNKPVSKCAECESIHSHIITATSRENLEHWALKRKVHYRHVKNERGVYHTMRKKGTNSEDGWVSLIIDGMDQRKTNVPSAGGSGDRDDSETLPTRIVGVKVHGRRNSST